VRRTENARIRLRTRGALAAFMAIGLLTAGCSDDDGDAWIGVTGRAT
jgi:hypothetical protein